MSDATRTELLPDVWEQLAAILEAKKPVDETTHVYAEAMRYCARDLRASLRAKETPSITCPRCKKTSYHPLDIEHRYCGFCHADMPPEETP